jgi:energy-coupling factor transporter ATP-binding protein EcfA2
LIPRPVAQAGERVVSVRNLRYVYEGGIEALKNINLDIASGEYMALVGGNGSGKTTLAKHFNGLLRPTGGKVFIRGRPAAEMSVAELSRIVGYAFQNPDHQLFCSTVEEEIAFGPRNLGFAEAQTNERVGYAAETLELEDVLEKPPASMDLGTRRRVSIASVIAMDPKVLILDEPTTGLDADETKALMGIVSGLNREGRTVVLITHEMKLVSEHANRVVVMLDGRIVLDSDARGAFSDLELLKRCSLLPPPVTYLAHRLAHLGVSREVLSTDEMVFELTRPGGDRR